MSSHRTILAATIVACAMGTGLSAQDCSILGQNTYVSDVMDQYYFWYREMPQVSPANFDSPEAYLEAVRFRPIDTSYSYISGRAATDAFFSNSQFVGIGFTQRQLNPDEIRVAQVFPDSPAAELGLRRGDYIVEIDGRSVTDLSASGELGGAFGPSTIGYEVQIGWRTLQGASKSGTVSKRPVTIPTVSQTKVLDLNGLPVGYVHFRNFVEPSTAALDQAFSELRREGVVDLVLDMRYNGGGLIDVARHLGSLIGGTRTNSQIFVEFQHNDKQTALNRQLRFENRAQALSVPRIVILTSRASASASELVISGLDPFMPVTLVGRRTYGKPVGQYGFNFCDKVVFPVSFKSVNARGEGDFFNGFETDCPMRDGFNRPLGHPEEAMLAEALYFLEHGTCSPESMAEQTLRTQATAGAEREAPPYGFDQLVNAR